jgi:uncharacterized repeat protein (TIGR01451 family)
MDLSNRQYVKNMSSHITVADRRRGLLICVIAVCITLFSTCVFAQRAFSSRYSNAAVRGDIAFAANVNWYCIDAGANCTSAQAGGNINNNSVTMVEIDRDTNAATTNSSIAQLNLPGGASVLFAGLYWSGVSTAAARNSVLFSTDGGGTYTSITASQLDVIGGNTYQGFANVTALVAATGSGSYAVGNLRSTSSTGNWGGWTLVVAYAAASAPATRNLSIFDGFQQATTGVSVNAAVTGLLTPATGVVNSTIGVVAYDGDRATNEAAAALQFGPTTASLSTVSNTLNPANNFFNSTISVNGANVTAGRNPTFTNTLGVDVDVTSPNTPLPNGATSAVVRINGSSNDVIFPGVVTIATDIFIPDIKSNLTKTVTDLNGGQVVPGDILEYEIFTRNTGQDGAAGSVFTDPIPANTSYVPGSIVIAVGANAGPKSDAAGDDQGEYDAGNNRVRVRVGTGANATQGGLLAPNDEIRIRFRVQVNDNAADDLVISNSGRFDYVLQTLGTPGFDISDSDPATPGDQPTVVTVSRKADLRVTKTNTPGVTGDVDQAADTVISGAVVAYTLTVSNAGPFRGDGALLTDTASGITLTGVSCLSASGGAACPAPASVTLALLTGSGIVIPTLPAGGSIVFQVTATVL